MSSTENTPESALWAAVIGTFAVDMRTLKTSVKPLEDKIDIADNAERDIKSEWIRYVCQMAGFDYRAISRRVLKGIEEFRSANGVKRKEQRNG